MIGDDYWILAGAADANFGLAGDPVEQWVINFEQCWEIMLRDNAERLCWEIMLRDNAERWCWETMLSYNDILSKAQTISLTHVRSDIYGQIYLLRLKLNHQFSCRLQNGGFTITCLFSDIAGAQGKKEFLIITFIGWLKTPDGAPQRDSKILYL